MASDDRLRELEEKYEDYKVYDNQGSKIGKVDDLFVDESDQEEYIGVKLGFFGMRSTLIPMDIVRVNETDRTIEVAETKDRIKDAPNFDDDDDITTEYEERIRSHFGLETHPTSRGGYGASSTDPTGAGSSAATGEEAAGAGAAAGTAASSSNGETGEQRAAGLGDDAEHNDYGEKERTDTAGEGVEDTDQPATENATIEPSTGTSEETGPEETRFGGKAAPGTPISRQTEETETFEEGGRTKIRRRIVREEVEDAGQGTDRPE